MTKRERESGNKERKRESEIEKGRHIEKENGNDDKCSIKTVTRRAIFIHH